MCIRDRYKTNKPLHKSRIVEERSPSLKRGKHGDEESYSPSKRRDQSPAPQNERVGTGVPGANPPIHACVLCANMAIGQ
eukprot:12317475-Prorocentrum_lima.AAC.1